MGCGSSSQEPLAPQSRHNPIKSGLTVKQKERLIDHIDSDDLPSLAVDMDNFGAHANSEISDQGMKWMLPHLCCRWDADDCLEYLLKQYFAEDPTSYVDLINAKTIEGHTCLHLCAIWMSERCLKVLINYGGLYLDAKDAKNMTAFEVALNYKNAENVKILKQFKDLQISFLTIQAERLLNGEIISDGQTIGEKKKVTREVKFDPELHKMAGNLFLHEEQKQKQANEKKRKIQEEMKKLEQEKKRKEEQVEKKQLESVLKVQYEEWERQEKEKQMKEKAEKEKKQSLKKEEEALRFKEQQLKKISDELQRLDDQKMQKHRLQEQRKTDELVQQRQAELRQRLQAQKNAIVALNRLESKDKVQKKKAAPADKPSGGIPAELPPEIVAKYEEAKAAGIFTDKDFPAHQSSLGKPGTAKLQSLTSNLKWMRPCDIFKGQYKLFDGIDQNDIKQGSLGVCYMLATISALAKNPENIKKIFVFHDLQLGFYVLKLYKHGIPTYFAVDDLIPCNAMTKSPLFTKPIGNEVWVLLLEKAWAKIIGNYLKAEAMTPDHIMEDLSGAPGFGAWFKNTDGGAKMMFRHLKLGHIIVLTTGNDKFEGIVANHAYTLLDAYQHNSALLFKIRNPWGRFEWNGEYGDKSSFWTEQLKRKVGFNQSDDGIFFLSESELTKVFVYFSINEIHPGHIYSYTQFQSGENEDLCYTFKITKQCELNLRVTQPFDRMLDDTQYKHSAMALQFGKIESDKKVKFISEGHNKSYFGAKSVHAFDDISKKLEPGEYFVRVNMYWKNSQKYNKGVIGVYCEEPVTIKKLPPEQGLARMQQLFFDFSQSKARSPSGDGFYKIVIMKGQFVFIGEIEQEGQHKITFTFYKDKMLKCVTAIGRVNETLIQLPLSKDNPAVGTARRTNPAEGGTTGPTSILIKPVQ